MRIYLDLCCFNRPYDDQAQTRIRLETEAKLVLQQKVCDGACELLWSAILDYENSRNPFDERLLAIQQWRQMAVSCVMADVGVVAEARSIMAFGVAEFDALHAASAVAGGANVFVTTDDKLLKNLRRFGGLFAAPPGEALAYLENWYED
ncbi:MAG: PIN domain protein [Gallionellales bacterium RIFCSPHIGHO2_02_FULL_57_16]|nr:MAG: PIN domain protein [Gallionellales bacterium RIFCSPHIGHO2_02_FULL_57_16]